METAEIVVVGAGMAAHRLCELLPPREGRRGRVVVFGDEPHPPYDRVHLTEYLAHRDVERLLLRDRSWYADRAIELRATAVVEIDLASRSVRAADGSRVAYRRLVLATGSAAVVPAVEGADLPFVFVYRTPHDLDGIAAAARAAATQGSCGALIGAGLLGLEAARALQALGCRVVLVERAERLMPRQLDTGSAAVLEEQMRSLGIDLLLGRQIAAVRADGRTRRVAFVDGSDLEVGFVVFTAGIRPRDELARAAGLACDPRGGVVVDDRLRTSDEQVFAIGECAVHRGRRCGLVAPVRAMAEVVADRLCGGSSTFAGVTAATRLKVDRVEVSLAGASLSEDAGVRRLVFRDERHCRTLVLDGDRLIGATAIGPWDAWPVVQECVARAGRLRFWQQRRFVGRGEIGAAGASVPVARWAEDATVCTCTGVTLGALRRAQAMGCRTAEMLAEQTSASSVCGSCRPLLEELTGERERGRPAPVGRGLLPIAAASALVVATIAIAGPVPLSTTVQQPVPFDELWRDPFVRKVSGSVTALLCVASLTFSLRKRWRRLKLGAFARWRLAHALLGTGALVAVAVHTGLRLGQNLDRMLMVSFLALSLLGAAAGAATAAESRLSAVAGGRLRRLGLAAHLVLFWPFPVLLAFHVWKVLWF
jgi:nitrite reductase (NADH) large subunit